LACLGHVTHGYHGLLDVPDSIDMVIHSGDATNYMDMYKNEVEMKDFIHWFYNLPIKYKIYVAGNHDSSIEKDVFNTKETMKDRGIIYLENDYVVIDGVKIWGSPFSPTFGNWSFMKARHNLDKVWRKIPSDADVVVTHTPPKRVLDLTYDRAHNLEYCGCNALSKQIIKLNPILHLFGHIHNNKDIINAGTMKLSIGDTLYSNGSVVTDGRFGKLSSNGNIFKIKK